MTLPGSGGTVTFKYDPFRQAHRENHFEHHEYLCLRRRQPHRRDKFERRCRCPLLADTSHRRTSGRTTLQHDQLLRSGWAWFRLLAHERCWRCREHLSLRLVWRVAHLLKRFRSSGWPTLRGFGRVGGLDLSLGLSISQLTGSTRINTSLRL
jgi:hypothetical protein